MRILQLALFMAIFNLIACQSPETKVPENQVSETTATTSSSESIATPDLKLNDGEKWVVNEQTGIGMKKISDVLMYFNNVPKESRNYKNLGEALGQQTQYIIENCDMTGPAHDELHVILYPILETITKLKESGGEADFRAMQKHMIAYYDYFNSESN